VVRRVAGQTSPRGSRQDSTLGDRPPVPCRMEPHGRLGPAAFTTTWQRYVGFALCARQVGVTCSCVPGQFRLSPDAGYRPRPGPATPRNFPRIGGIGSAIRREFRNDGSAVDHRLHADARWHWLPAPRPAHSVISFSPVSAGNQGDDGNSDSSPDSHRYLARLVVVAAVIACSFRPRLPAGGQELTGRPDGRKIDRQERQSSPRRRYSADVQPPFSPSQMRNAVNLTRRGAIGSA